MNKVLRLCGENAFVTTRHFGLCVKNTNEFGDPEPQKKFLKCLTDDPIKIPRRFVYLDQVHGARVTVLDTASEHFTRLTETDAVVTDLKDLGLIVMTAGCLSVFFLAGEWVGLAHAGWRGTKEKIAAKTLRTIVAKSGQKPEVVRIIFGPCIRSCHYEVGGEFKSHFDSNVVRERSGKLTFDIALENEKQLVEAGALESKLFDSGICTVCQSSDFYSYRLEKESAGRMISWVALQ